MDAHLSGLASSQKHATSDVLAIAAVVLVAINLRPGIVSVGPLLPSVIVNFALSHTVASLLVSIPDVLMGALALPTPWLARRFGRDKVILVALCVLFASILARAFATTTLQLLTATVGVGAGIAIAGALVGGFIKARFPNRAALLVGLYATCLSLGSTISAALAGPIATQTSGGWRLAAGVWGGLGVFAIGGWLAVAIAESRTLYFAATGPVHHLPLRNPKAWLIAIYFACINFLFYALVSWTVPIYREVGLSPTNAGATLATFIAVFMFGSLAFGWISRSHDRRFLLALGAGLGLLGLLSIALTPLTLPFAAIACCAFGLGGAFALGMTLPLDNTGNVEEANVWNAFVLTIGYLIASGGPLTVGYLRDINGTYTPSLLLLVFVAALMLAVSPFLGPVRRRL